MRDSVDQLPARNLTAKNLTADNLKDHNLGRCTPRPDRCEVAAVLHQSGAPDGFSLEWMFDRFVDGRAQDVRHT